MTTSAVPPIQWTPAGPVLPTDAQVLAGVQSDLNTAFGGNLNPSLETPQGQLASSTAAIIADKNAQIALVATQVDPDYASGIWQDAIGRIYFMDRIAAAGTVVQCTVVGLSGVIIPIGALAVDPSTGYQYACTAGTTIPVSGSASATFTCLTVGPVAVPSALNIYQSIPGWDSITPVSGVEGNLVETQQEFEIRRKASVALNANGSVQSVRAAVLQVPGVISCYAVDNPSSSAQTIGGVTLAPNSIYVAVVGGNAQAVAYAIWSKKSAGCSYNGNASVTVTDSSQGSLPYPTYTVQYTVPTNTPILFAVQIKANPALAANINTLIQNAIIGAFSGQDGGAPVSIGSTVFASRFYATVAATDPNCEVVSIQIGTTTANQNYLAMNINQYPTISASNITITQV
jgi:hypothetical protein